MDRNKNIIEETRAWTWMKIGILIGLGSLLFDVAMAIATSLFFWIGAII